MSEYLRDSCEETICEHLHSSRTYEWEYFSQIYGDWVSFQAEICDKLEEQYCDVNVESCTVKMSTKRGGKIPEMYVNHTFMVWFQLSIFRYIFYTLYLIQVNNYEAIHLDNMIHVICFSAKVSFLEMTMDMAACGENYRLRRLSTASSECECQQSDAGKYYTTWCWYFRNPEGIWKAYNEKVLDYFHLPPQFD